MRCFLTLNCAFILPDPRLCDGEDLGQEVVALPPRVQELGRRLLRAEDLEEGPEVALPHDGVVARHDVQRDVLVGDSLKRPLADQRLDVVAVVRKDDDEVGQGASLQKVTLDPGLEPRAEIMQPTWTEGILMVFLLSGSSSP